VAALVDTGSGRTIVSSRLVPGVSLSDQAGVLSVDGRQVKTRGECVVRLSALGFCENVSVIVMDRLVGNLDAIVGMDLIARCGGVHVSARGVSFGACENVKTKEMPTQAAVTEAVLTVEDADFLAKFDGAHWTVWWKWKDGVAPGVPEGASNCPIPASLKADFAAEIEEWIHKGWLVPADRSVGAQNLPLLAVEQRNKGKVRPVMDFRALNEHLESHTGDSHNCKDTLREWRQKGENLGVLDLKKAYLQIRVGRELWPYQRVLHNGRVYHLTRLGFGLCSAPAIMSKILRKVLEQNLKVKAATSHYIDDILVDQRLCSLNEVQAHLIRFGLECKPPDEFCSSKVLGLQLIRDGSEVKWKRGNQLPQAAELNDRKLTRRDVFSICGRIVGHYPVAGWSRVQCSLLKRYCEGSKWNDDVGPLAKWMLEDVLRRVAENDPARGWWAVPQRRDGVVWCDASDVALGVALAVDGRVVEDAAWLRKEHDTAHINLAELDAVLRGVSLAIRWRITELTIRTDSVTVQKWLVAVLENRHPIKSSALAEMLIRRRLGIFRELVETHKLDVRVQFVPSERNIADSLTRGPVQWKKQASQGAAIGVGCPAIRTDEEVKAAIKKVHERAHFGVKRTAYFVHQEMPDAPNKLIKQVVRQCIECNSIDPEAVRVCPGSLSVPDVWHRLAIDVTHVGSERFLTIIDCGPSRFGIWRKLPSEDAETVSRVMEDVFQERGPPRELLLDNATAFRSQALAELCLKWGVHLEFRAAYYPQGNGIVERHHRTIKRIVARARVSPLMAVHRYNSAPMVDELVESCPAHRIYAYRWRKGVSETEASEVVGNPFTEGQSVFVRPADARCMSRWRPGVISRVVSRWKVEVDGMPRHIRDIRATPESEDSTSEDEVSPSPVETTPAEGRYPRRERRAPDFLVPH